MASDKVKTVSELLRESIISKAPRLGAYALESLRFSEWSPEFEQLMRNRLIIGALRFGKLTVKRKPGCSQFHIRYIQEKLDEYRATGNAELLVDIANLSLIEFIHGDHPCKHFKALDRRD